MIDNEMVNRERSHSWESIGQDFNEFRLRTNLTRYV